MKLVDEFVLYLQEQMRNRSIYVWGAQGQQGNQITEVWIRSREKGTGGYSNQTYADAAVELWKKRCKEGFGLVLRAFDCSGLGIYWLYNIKKIFPGDNTAQGMWSKCKKKLKRDTAKKGDWCFSGTSSKKSHIGYIINDNGDVIEARGRQFGVVQTNIRDSRWEYFARPDVFASEIEGETSEMQFVQILGGSVNIRTSNDTAAKILKVAHKGEKYPFMEKALNGWYKIKLGTNDFGYISNRIDLTKLI